LQFANNQAGKNPVDASLKEGNPLFGLGEEPVVFCEILSTMKTGPFCPFNDRL
jgi:hypothetical protein